MLGCICAPGRVILPEPLHHILDPPDLLLDLPVEHLILKHHRGGQRKWLLRSIPALGPVVGRSFVYTCACMHTHIPLAHIHTHIPLVHTHTHTLPSITHIYIHAHPSSTHTHISFQPMHACMHAQAHTHTALAHSSFSQAASVSSASIIQRSDLPEKRALSSQ